MRRPNARPQTLAPVAAGPNSSTDMDPTRAHLRPSPRRRRRRYALIAATILSTLLALYLLSSRFLSSPLQFGIVIDAGSTGTRIHVVAYRHQHRWGPLPDIDMERTSSMRATPGLSAFSSSPANAGESLIGLLQFVRKRVPEQRWGETEIRLMATAGMRLLNLEISERILESCRAVLRGSGFRFQDEWASVISGAHEGMYAWVVANYALGTLGGDPEGTAGIVELGGASAQVTFITGEPFPPEFAHILKFGEVTYNLYSHSFLHLGQNVAYESLHDFLSSRVLKSSAASGANQQLIYRDPCTPRGFLHSTEAVKLSASAMESEIIYRTIAHAVGNFSECRSAAFTLLQKGKEQYIYDDCHLGTAFIPKLQGRFLAMENFYHTSKFFGLGQKLLLSDLVLAGEQFCQEDWSNLKKNYHSMDEGELLLYCFSSAYIVALLHDSLGISMDDTRIEFTNQVRSIPLDWALGAFVVQKALNQTTGYLDWISYVASYTSSGMFSVFLISVVIIIAACSILRWRRPHLKTIYDMEKGRYIITRVNR